LFIAGAILHSDRFQVPFFIFTFVLPDFCTLFLYAIFLLILKTCTLFLCDFFRHFCINVYKICTLFLCDFFRHFCIMYTKFVRYFCVIFSVLFFLCCC
jgi:hypothetical protein